MKKITIIDIIFVIISVFLCFGAEFIFNACGPKPDGSWMNCHQVQNITVLFGLAFTVLNIARLFFNNLVKLGISVANGIFSIVLMFVPGHAIHLCMMKDMRCWTVTKPVILVLSFAILALSIADIVYDIKKNKTQKV